MSNIEDDVKTLRKIILFYKDLDTLYDNDKCLEIKAIENILLEREQNKARIKELEEENMQKDLKKIGIEEKIKADMKEIIERYYTANEKCIPKQKVKDKIEKLKKDYDKKYDLFMGHKFQSKEQQDILKQMRILKELLEEGE